MNMKAVVDWGMVIAKFGAIFAALIGVIGAFLQFYVQKRNERTTVNKAILSEISRLLHVLCKHRIWWEGCKANNNTDLPIVPFSMDVYDNFLKNIGDLHRSYASEAVSFYGYIKFLNALQKLRADHIAIGKEQVFVDTYLASLSNIVSRHYNKFDAAFTKYAIELPVIDQKCLQPTLHTHANPA